MKSWYQIYVLDAGDPDGHRNHRSRAHEDQSAI
jgi:hypothetical protein